MFCSHKHFLGRFVARNVGQTLTLGNHIVGVDMVPRNNFHCVVQFLRLYVGAQNAVNLIEGNSKFNTGVLLISSFYFLWSVF